MDQTIEVYTVSIQKKDDPENLIFSDGDDIYPLVRNQFKAFVGSEEGRNIGHTEERTLEVPRINGRRIWGHDDNRRYVYGVIKSGKYGRKIEVANKNAPETKLYVSDNNEDAVLKPFFFLISIPKQGDLAFVVFERTDNESIRRVFQKLLVGFLNSRRPVDRQAQKYTVQFDNFLSREYVEDLRNGTIKSMTLSMKKLPADLTDEYMNDYKREETTLSLTMKFKGGLMPDSKLSKAIRDRKTIFSNKAFSSFFDESEAKIVTRSEINGVSRIRTVYLSEGAKKNIRPYYSVTVERNVDGYSDYDSIRGAVYDFIEHNEELKPLN